jgi:threonine dehydrogenase-like Zn-dependent dehydrogenase
MSRMWALRANAGEAKPRLEQIDIPEVGAGDVLIKVGAAGLAPGMITLLERGLLKPLPMTLGHEAAGTVAAVGNPVSGFKVGDRVRLHPTMSCGRCAKCVTDRQQMCESAAMMGFVAFGARPVDAYDTYRNGGLAEYVKAPQAQVDHLPDNVSAEVGAKVHDLANAVRCLKSAELPAGATVIVLAPTGTMGTATLKIAPYFGIARLVLVGRNAARLEALRTLANIKTDIIAADRLGEDWAKSQALARAVAQLLPQGADAVIDYVPHGTDFWQALSGLAVGGRFVHMGGNPSAFPMPMIALLQKCWTIVATRNHSRSDVRLVLDLLASGRVKVDDLITHRFRLSDIDAAISAFRSRDLPIWMGVVNP